ncbi:MAG: hypothetical protein Q9208_004960 [Pyrenodesmia sp. 3 TL-2023]
MNVRDLTSYFKNAAISTILKNNMQNWTGEKELKLFGLDDLVKKNNQWDIDIKDYLLASYNHYETVGLGGNTMLPTVDELLEGKVSSTSGSFLPVCDSYMPVQAPSTNHLPCMCGDENGSETLAFWDEANFQSWTAAHKNGREEPHYLCMYDMGKYRVPPVPYYLNLCSLDTRWSTQPLLTDIGEHIPNGRDVHHLIPEVDPYCEIVQGHVDLWRAERANNIPATRPQRGVDLNCDICFHSKIGKTIRQSQQKDVTNEFDSTTLWDSQPPWNEYNFDFACHDYGSMRPCDMVDVMIDPNYKRGIFNSTLSDGS